MKPRYRLAIFNSHPIQYFAPLYARLARQEDIDLKVFYGSRQGIEAGRVDPGFGAPVKWDVPLLEGYEHEFLYNVGGDRGVNGFLKMVNPGIVSRLVAGRFDAVIVHGHNLMTNLMAIATAKLIGTRVFMRGETHLLLERRGLKGVLRGPVMTAFYKVCDACLYIGSRNKAFYEKHGVAPGRLFFVPYTVDNDRFSQRAQAARPRSSELRTTLGVREGATLILFASKLTTRKRPMDLLEAFASIRLDGVDAELLFVGSGELGCALEERSRELGIPVHFAGFVNQRDLPAYFAAADVFVLPSENEPWGLIINEAMCAGLPVVTTSEVGAAADLVREGETGLLFERGDVEGLGKCLATLSADASLRRRLGSNAREFIGRWSYEQCIDGIRSALAAGGPPRT